MKLEYLYRGFPGHPLHPPLTDATIGAYTFALAGAVLDVLEISDEAAASGWALAMIVALVISAATALTGFADWLQIERGTPLWRTATAHLFAMVGATVVFLLAIFHVIPRRRHVVALLLGLGTLALVLGAATAYYHFLELEVLAPRLIRETAGPAPANEGQRAAVVVLPLIVGLLTLAGDVLGCLYMAVFWGGSLLARKRTPRSTQE